MPKGDDHLQKKKSKAIRKRMRRAGADSMEAIQGVQAAKRRRKAGTRRACEGMCYTLPTPDDPFNERNDQRRRRKANRELRRREVPAGEILEFETYADNANGSDIDVSAGYEKQLKRRRVLEDDREEQELDTLQNSQKQRKLDGEKSKQETFTKNQGKNGNLKKTSSKSEDLQVLNLRASSVRKEVEANSIDSIDDAVLVAITGAGLLSNGSSNASLVNRNKKKGGNKQVSVFGKQIWEAFTKGVDVLAVSSIAWEERALGYVVPAAAHINIQRSQHAMLEKPLVLITVASQDQAIKVRRICKALKKALGISSVALHAGTSLEHQIKGLSLQTPEIIVATPDRLDELHAHKAISLSSISFLVIDGLDEIINNGFQAEISKLKEYVCQGARTLIVSNNVLEKEVMIVRQLVMDPIVRVLSEPNLKMESVCITQAVSVFTSINKRLPKILKLLQQFWESHEANMTRGILVLVENADTVEELLPTIIGIGYAAMGLTGPERSEVGKISKQLSEGSVQALVTTEEFLGEIPLERMQLVINYKFPSTMETYKQILTGMARQSVHGVLHSFCTASMACLASDLVQDENVGHSVVSEMVIYHHRDQLTTVALGPGWSFFVSDKLHSDNHERFSMNISP